MIKNILLAFSGLLVGIITGYLLVFQSMTVSLPQIISPLARQITSKEVIGFLPYWLLSKADKNYDQYITSLAYFGVTIGADGKIVKLANPREEEPGWYALKSGKADPFFAKAKKDGVSLSLVAFSADNDAISQLIANPQEHAQNFLNDIAPVMKQYGFTNLNLDVENTNDASKSAQANFARFVGLVKQGLYQQKLGTLSIDVAAIDFVKQKLVDPFLIGKLADKTIIMAYDYHFTGSEVTGPVAPLNGAGDIYEFDTNTAVLKALEIMPPGKIILGIPLYGYEWETIGALPQSAIIPGTGIVASNSRVENLLNQCASCSSQLAGPAKENYLIYKDQATGTYHQIFYPDGFSLKEKIRYADLQKLGGLALWALGYEGKGMLTPLNQYRNSLTVF